MKENKVAKKVFKVISIVLLVVLVVFMINLIRKLVIIKSIQSTASQYTSSTNYHVKSVSSGTNEDYVMTINSYYKDGRRLVILERSKDGKVVNKISMHDNGKRRDTFYENEGERKVDIDSDFDFIMPIFDYFEGNSNMQLICVAIASKVENTEYNGKQCYRIANCPASSILKEDNSEIDEVYIDKDTGLVVRTHFGNSISEREYEFDNVSDGVFVEPDIGEYEIMKE